MPADHQYLALRAAGTGELSVLTEPLELPAGGEVPYGYGDLLQTVFDEDGNIIDQIVLWQWVADNVMVLAAEGRLIEENLALTEAGAELLERYSESFPQRLRFGRSLYPLTLDQLLNLLYHADDQRLTLDQFVRDQNWDEDQDTPALHEAAADGLITIHSGPVIVYGNGSTNTVHWATNIPTPMRYPGDYLVVLTEDGITAIEQMAAATS
jgi:hypothetical protein